MPGQDGLSLARALGSGKPAPAVVFVTAYETFAVGAFDVHAIDYLVKPFTQARLDDCLAYARRLLSARGVSMAAGHDADRQAPMVPLRVRGRVAIVAQREIVRLEASGNHVRVHLAGGEERISRGTLEQPLERLDPRVFVRVHRSHVVRLERVRTIGLAANREYEFELRDGTRLPVGRRFAKALLSSMASERPRR